MARDLRRTGSRAFTMVELLVVMAVIVILMGILLPALSSVFRTGRYAVTGSNLRQIGAATIAYLDNWNNHLPQKAWDVGGGQRAIVGTLFGGKRGTIPFFGINQVGSDRRPLNKYLQKNLGPRIDSNGNVIGDTEVEVFESPLDIGGDVPGLGAFPSFYDALGSSYTLNDHCLSGEQFATLVPRQSADGKPGGRMPPVVDPSFTWMIAEHTIYNYQEFGDRGLRWYRPGSMNEFASMCMVDGTVKTNVPVPIDDGSGGHAHTTPNYTFLPDPDWPCQ